MLVWTEAYSPFIMGGDVNAPIATELEGGEPVHLDHGVVVYLITSPCGKVFVAEGTTGAFVGTGLEQVKRDVANSDPDVICKQLTSARERVKKATILDNEQFWRMFK